MPKGQPVTLTFNYDGRLTGKEDSPIYGITFAAIQRDYAFLLYPARWFPVSGYTTDRFTSKINVTVPQGYVVLGSGIDSKPVAAGDGTTFSFDFTKPSFPGDIAIEKGQPVKNSTDGITTTLWFRDAEASVANAYGDGNRRNDGVLHRHLWTCALCQPDRGGNRRRSAERICGAGRWFSFLLRRSGDK